MRRNLEDIRNHLERFIMQRDNLVLVIPSTDVEAAYVLKTLDAVEELRPECIMLSFGHAAAGGANQYLDELMSTVIKQVTAINAIREDDGSSLWDPLPQACTQHAPHPAERFKALIRYIRQYVPDPKNKLVVSLMPAAFEDPNDFGPLVGALLPRSGAPEPWMTGVRIIVREDRAGPELTPQLQIHGGFGVQFYEGVDLSPRALEDSLVDTVIDESYPEAERMAALMQLAALDFSHRRYHDSVAKYARAFEFYEREGAVAMASMCLWGAGEAYRQSDMLPEAKERYQQGLAMAQTEEGISAALNNLLGLGEVCVTRNEWEEADGYLELAEQVAAKLGNAYARAQAMDLRGHALLALNKVQEAQESWLGCANLSREIKDPWRAESALKHLLGLYTHHAMPGEMAKTDRALKEVKAEQKIMLQGAPS